jgi:hypothetical protein
MVTMRNILVYRAEFPYSEITCARPNPSVVVFDITGERQFGSRKHTDRRYGGLTFCCETASRSPAERRGDQRLSNLGGARCYSVQMSPLRRACTSNSVGPQSLLTMDRKQSECIIHIISPPCFC